MKRRHTSNDFYPINHAELSRKTAIHEAGHAAAIYLGNKQKQLPPVFFRYLLKNSIATFYRLDVYANHMILVIIVLLK